MFKIPKYIVIFLSYFSICFFGCQQQEKTVIKTVPVVKKKTVKKDIETNKGSLIRRQCTNNYKITPVYREIRKYFFGKHFE